MCFLMPHLNSWECYRSRLSFLVLSCIICGIENPGFYFRTMLRIRTTKAKLLLVTMLIILVLISSYIFYNTLTQTQTVNLEELSILQITDRNTKKLKTIYTAQLNYKARYQNLSAAELEALNSRYYRDVGLYWNSPHGLRPQSKPLPGVSCVRHLDNAHHVTDSVSIVICMKDELVYLMLRTLTTIMEHTTRGVLKEVVVIDDGSRESVEGEVVGFCQGLDIPVRFIRNEVSVGITKCRNQGIQRAEGEVVVILDSHVEVAEGWLEPLLEILAIKPDSIAVPTFHLINEKDYTRLHLDTVKPYGIEMTGGYSWFRYYDMNPGPDMSIPYPTASILGGALAAHRSTLLQFYPLPVYPEYWGTENSRLSVRMWSCGGGMWMSWCSQVLHTNGPDGNLQRYKQDRPNMIQHLQRETLGDIINLIPNAEDKVRMLHSVYRDPKEIEKVLNISKIIATQFNVSACPLDYLWYLRNIQPQKSAHFLKFRCTDTYQVVGEAQSVAHPDYCIATDVGKVFVDVNCRKDKTLAYDTHLLGFTHYGEVHTTVQAFRCWDSGQGGANGTKIISYSCHWKFGDEEVAKTQDIRYDGSTKQIKHVATDRCVQIFTELKTILLVHCSDSDLQKWNINVPRWLL